MSRGSAIYPLRTMCLLCLSGVAAQRAPCQLSPQQVKALSQHNTPGGQDLPALLQRMGGPDRELADEAVGLLLASRDLFYLRNAQRCTEDEIERRRIQLILDAIGRRSADYVGPGRPPSPKTQVSRPIFVPPEVRDRRKLLTLGRCYPVDLELLAAGVGDDLASIRKISCSIAAAWGPRAESLRESLLALRKDTDPVVRAESLRALIKIGCRSADLWVPCLALIQAASAASHQRSLTWPAQVAILEWAGTAGDRGLAVLEQALESKSASIREEALYRLIQQKAAALALYPRIFELEAELKQPGFSRWVLLLLGEIGIRKGSRCAHQLAPLLRKHMPTIRWETLKALRNHPEWIFELSDLPLSALAGKDLGHQIAAVHAMSMAPKLPTAARVALSSWLANARHARPEDRRAAVNALSLVEGDDKQRAVVLLKCLTVPGAGATAARLLGDLSRSVDSHLQDWLLAEVVARASQRLGLEPTQALGTAMGALAGIDHGYLLQYMRKSGAAQSRVTVTQRALAEMARRRPDELRAALRGEDRLMRALAINACKDLGQDAAIFVPDLLNMAEADPSAYLDAADALAALKSRKALPMLARVLRSEKPQERMQALASLARMGPMALRVLFDATDSPEPATRARAILILLRTKHDKRSLPTLMALLRSGHLDRHNRKAVLRVLHGYGPVGRKALLTLDLPRSELGPWISRIQIGDDLDLQRRTLAWLSSSVDEWTSSPSFFEVLIRARETELRLWCARALGKNPGVEGQQRHGTVIRLLGMQHDWDPGVRLAVVQSLEAVGARSAWSIEAFIQALADRSVPVACAAAKALGGLGPEAKRAIPALRVAQESKHETLQKAANKALNLIEL